MSLMRSIFKAIFRRRVSNFQLLVAIHNTTEAIIMKQSELEAKLVTINTTLEKARTEIVSAVADLKTQIENSKDPELSAGATAQLDRLSAVGESLDALNEDKAPENPAPVDPAPVDPAPENQNPEPQG